MFRWLRRNEGFEWHKYVRTTIKVRRDDRRRRVGEVGDAIASSGQSALGAAGGSLAALGRLLIWPFVWLGTTLFSRRPFSASPAERALNVASSSLAMPVVRLFAGLIAAALLVSSIAAAFGDRVDGTARLTALAGVVLGLIAAGPLLARYVLLPVGRPVAGMTQRVRGARAATSTGVTMALGAAVVLVGSAGATAVMSRVAPSMTAPFARIVTGSTGVIEGRGTAVGADLLRVGDTLVRLAEIEQPAPESRCAKPGGSPKARKQTTPCSRAAFEALQTRVRGKMVQCTPSGRDDAGRPKARCTVDGEDLAQALVRDGYVKTAGGLFASYGSDESAAKAARAGLWASADDAASGTKRKR